MVSSSVIKAGEAGRVLKQVSSVDLAEHIEEARLALDRARSEAAAMVARAREQSRRLEAEAERRGREEGHKAGEEAGRREGFEAARREAIESFQAQQRPVIEDFERVIRELDERKAELRGAAERHLLEFAVTLARRMTFAIGELRRDTAPANLERALGLIESRTDLTVRVHPSDVDAMRLFAPRALDRARSASAVEIVEDDSMAPGGCVVETRSGEVDATLETQAEELARLLLGGGLGGA